MTPDYNAPNQPTYGGSAQPVYGNNAQPGYGNGGGAVQPNNAQAGYGNGNNPDPPTPPQISNDGWTVSNGPPATVPVAVPAGALPAQQIFGVPGASSVETSIIEIGRNPSQNNLDSYGSPAADPIGVPAPDSYGSPAAEPIGQQGGASLNSNVPAPRAPAAPGSGGPVPAPQSDTYDAGGPDPGPSAPAPQSDTYDAGAGGPVPDQTNPTVPRTDSALAPTSNSAPALNPYSDISNSVPLKTGRFIL